MKKRTLLLACGMLLSSAVSWAAAFDDGTTDSIATVGTGGDYASLAAAATAFNAVSGINANWEIRILNNLTETSNVAFGNTIAGGKTVTIRPAPGVSPTVSFTSTTANNGSAFSGNLVLGCNVIASAAGASNVFNTSNAWIIDGSNLHGGSRRSMTFTTVASGTGDGNCIRIVAGTQGAIIRNLVINQIRTNASAACIGIAAANISSTDYVPNGTVISNCVLKTSSSGSGMAIRTGTGVGTLSSGTAIENLTVENCDIIFTSRGLEALNLGGGASSTHNFRRNRLILSNAAGNTWPVFHSSSNTTSGYTFNIEENYIEVNMTSLPAAGQGPSALELTAGTGTYNVRNNIIHFNPTTVAGTVDGIWRGINATSATNAYNIEHNTINMDSSSASLAGGTAGRICAINAATARTSGTLTLRNNIIRMGQPGTNVFMIRNSAGTTGFTSVGNNLIPLTGLPNLGIVGSTTYNSFGDWQTAGFDTGATGGQSVQPTSFWVGAPDFRFLTDPSGTVGTVDSSTVLTDIDGRPRPANGALPGAHEYTTTSTTYSYNGTSTGTGDFDSPGEWDPVRNYRRITDVLEIDGASLGGALTLNLPSLNTAAATARTLYDSPIGGLRLLNNADVTLTAANARNINVYDNTGTDLQVGSGSSLTLTGSNTIRIILNGSASGSIGGDLVLAATAASVPHAILVKSAGGLVFTNGATAALAPTTTGGGNGFGADNIDSAAGAVVFQSGATFYQGGKKDGTRPGGTGSNPFGPSGANAIVVFNSGSTYVTLRPPPPSISNRTYGNFIWRSNTSGSPTGTLTFTVQNNFEVRNSGDVVQGACNLTGFTGPISIGGDLIVEAGGPALNMNSAPTATTNITVGGNVDIQDLSLFTAPADTDHVWVFNGSSNQTLDFEGATLTNATINNASGATLDSDLFISGTLTYTAGDINRDGNTLIAGTVVRSIDATTTGARQFPVGTGGNSTPVTFDITSAGTGTGSMTVTSTGTDHPNVLDAAGTINRFWSLTPSGISGFTATLTFNYLDSDLGSVNEASLAAGRYTGTGTIWDVLGGTVNTVANTVTVTGVTSLSDWTLGEAASLPVELDLFLID
ncbi:MAG: hypothetical protein KF858_02930 [Candidatus Sumerlaeia bacterium]|nr:hypothetical protein [Candidatus Sumerlaeia bacterium]